MTINIRSSMLPSYFDCARRAASKQFKREIEQAGFKLRETAPSVGAALGTAVHAAGEYMMRHKLDHFEIGNEQHAVELAVAKFEEETAPGAEWDDTTPNANAAVFQMKRLIGALAEFGQRITPAAVELELRADAGDGFELTGHVDIVTADGWVRDWKTGALSRPYQAQLGAYSLLARSEGHQVHGVAIDWIARAPKTKPQPPVETQTYQVATCERAAWATVQRIKRDATEFMETGDAWKFPANPMTMMCSARFCPAHGTSFCDMHSSKE